MQKYDFSRYNEKFDAYELICECVRIKSRVVELDPTEKGLRKILNVGHTVGHALESADSYELSHGEYVAAGMLVEAEMCKDRIDEGFFAELRTTSKINVLPERSCPIRTSSARKVSRVSIVGTIRFSMMSESPQRRLRIILTASDRIPYAS